MKYVESSNIDAIQYLKSEKKLVIMFKNGNSYEWNKVPMTKYKALMESDSKGRYFNNNIKGKYRGKKLKGNNDTFNDVKDFFEL
jgi:hypothetical protein